MLSHHESALGVRKEQLRQRGSVEDPILSTLQTNVEKTSTDPRPSSILCVKLTT